MPMPMPMPLRPARRPARPTRAGVMLALLAALPVLVPVAGVQAAQTGCHAHPVIGREGAILYWTLRVGCVGMQGTAASEDGTHGPQVAEMRRSGDPVAERATPVRGVAIDAPVRR